MKILIEGLIFSIVLGVIVTGSQLVNPRFWLNCYPEGIQKKVPKRTKREMIAKMIVGVPFLLIMFGYPVYSTIVLKKNLGEEYTFLPGFLNILILENMFNLFDLLILDWLIFCKVNPDYLVLVGTGGMKEYKDYGFHFRAAMKGFWMSIVFSIIVAGITVL